MATPYIAGCYALLLQAVPSIKRLFPPNQIPQVAQIMMMNGANAMSTEQGNNTIIDSVMRQGAGLLDIRKSITSQTTVVPSKISLGQFQPFPGENDYTSRLIITKLRIINFHQDKRKYSLYYQRSLSMNGSDVTNPSGAIIDWNDLIVEFDSDSFEVKSLQTHIVEITFRLPSSTSERYPDKEFWLLAGYINVASPTEVISVPFAGFKGSMNKVPLLEYKAIPSSKGKGFPHIFSPKTGSMFARQNGTKDDSIGIFSLASINEDIAGIDAPILRFRLAHGSPSVNARLIDSETRELVGYVDFESYLGRNDYETDSEWHQITFDGYVWDAGIGVSQNSGQQLRKSSTRLALNNDNQPEWMKNIVSRIEDFLGIALHEDETSWRIPVSVKNESISLITDAVLHSRGIPIATNQLSKSKTSRLSSAAGDRREVPNGVYRFILRVFAPFGTLSDYETWESPSFEIHRSS
jgi:hypothetical protein